MPWPARGSPTAHGPHSTSDGEWRSGQPPGSCRRSWPPAVGWIVLQLTGQEPDENQIVAEMATTLPPLVAIGLIGILTPMAEEFFFRWIAVNAWEREHGTRVAILGSAVLFGAAHVLGGTWLACPRSSCSASSSPRPTWPPGACRW